MKSATKQAIAERILAQKGDYFPDEMPMINPKHFFTPRRSGKHLYQEMMIEKMQDNMIKHAELKHSPDWHTTKRISTDEGGNVIIENIPDIKRYLSTTAFSAAINNPVSAKNATTEKVTLTFIDGAFE